MRTRETRIPSSGRRRRRFNPATIVSQSFTAISSGGVVVGGFTLPSGKYFGSSGGGPVLGGSASGSINASGISSGGPVAGGSASPQGTFSEIAFGGPIVGGAVSPQGTFSETASGGAIVGGSASGSTTGAWLYIQGSGNDSSGSVASLTATFPGSVTSGNLIVVGCNTNAATTLLVSDSAGNVYSQAATATFGSNNQKIGLFYAQANATGPLTVTLTPGTSSTVGLSIDEFQCNSGGWSYDGQSGRTDGGTLGTTLSAGTLTLSGTDLVVAVGRLQQNHGTTIYNWSAGSGYTLTHTQNGAVGINDMATEYLLNATTATSASLNATGNASNWAIVSAAFKPSGPTSTGQSSGGAVVGGSASGSNSSVITGISTGGPVVGGAAFPSFSGTITAQGGPVAGGASVASAVFTLTTKGGPVAGGSAIPVANSSATSSGGPVVGGFAAGFIPTPSTTISTDSIKSPLLSWKGDVGGPSTSFGWLGLPYAILPAGQTVGNAAITLGRLSGSATGNIGGTVSGSASITLGSTIAVASAVTTTVGISFDISYGASIAWNGSVGAPRTLLGGIGLPYAIIPSGAVIASASIILGALSPAAAATIEASGAADITMGSLVVAASGVSGVGASADIQLGPLVVAAEGFIPSSGTAVIILGPLAIIASGSGGGSPPPPPNQDTTFGNFFSSVQATVASTGVFGPKSVVYVVEPDAAAEFPALPPPFLLIEPGEFSDNGWSEGGGRNTKVWSTEIRLHLVVQNTLDPGFFADNVVTSPNTTFGIYSIAQLIIDKFEQAYVTDNSGQLQLVQLPVSPTIGAPRRKDNAGNYVSTVITFQMLVAEKLPSNLP